ncbi:MAG: HEPN domain-containing protein [Pseudomonadota bacterium]
MMFSARALQELIRSFGNSVDPSSNAALFEGQFIARPVLAAFAMELALKAWWAKENKDSDIPKTHDLLKLFDGLNEETRTRLESAHPEIPHPCRGLSPIRPGLRSILDSNSDAFVEWRYVHELSSARFPDGEFNEALSSVIKEFDRTPR